MDVQVTYQNGVKFQASCRGHQILSDQSLDSYGQDEGMTPPEWFLSSLGACVGFYAVKYLEARHLATSGLEIAVTADKVTDPLRIDHIHIQVKSSMPIEPRHQKGLERAVDACIIHNTLTHPPTITTEVLSPAIAE
ncbi:OsmC family protein [Nodosilinea sp. LEGE 07298]|uniref:OsmC family protein n=1 Tax=Nodosilinea sp. LEGE 07298 TaxID=2777970 RepID=UPI00187F5AF6|nr:OsmC family protein [Nodosilinea sp. LEGE 07298]MBE9113392.1 OsmC family protein [Nodosilinea sp. LEGE 07298]